MNNFITADAAQCLMKTANSNRFDCAPFYTLMFDNIRKEAKQGYGHIFIDIIEYEYKLGKVLTAASRIHLMDNMVDLATKNGFKCTVICRNSECVFKVSWAD